MAIIVRMTQDKVIRFQVKVRDPDGNWYPTSTYDDVTSAKVEEGRLLQLKQQGRKAVSSDAKTYTVDDYWEVWSVENRPETSEGWKISQNQMYRDYIKPVIGSKKIAEVGRPDIGRLLNRVKDLGRGDQMRKHVYSLVRQMFYDALKYYEMIPHSPVEAEFHRPKVKKAKRDFLTPQQAFHLLDYVKGHYLGPAIWLQILSAMRVSEAQALRWASVQWDASQILIRAAYNRKVKELQDFPKQSDWAYVPMPPLLKKYLGVHWMGKRPEAFVAPGPDGSKMLSYHTYHRALKTLCQKAGLPMMDTHELRHTSTEIYFQAGASTEDVRRLLNHGSLTSTSGYIHRTDERLSLIASNLELTLFPRDVPMRTKEAGLIGLKEPQND